MTEQLQLLSVESLRPAKWNRDVGDVSELAASIADVGLIEPIVVRSNGATGFEVVAGERRWRAAQAAGLTEIPTIVRELDDRQALEVQLIENLQRKDIEPLEEAEGYRRLVEFGVKQSEIATKVRRSQAHVSKRLALLDLPDVAQKQLSVGKLTVENALDLLKLKDHPNRLEKLLNGSHYGGLGYAVRDELSRIKSSEKHAAAKKRLKDAGVKVVGRPGYNSKTKRLDTRDAFYGESLGIKPGDHKKEPCHAAYIDQYDQKVVYVCTDPSRHGAKGESAIKSTSKAVDDSERQTRESAAQKRKREREERDAAAIEEATNRRRAFIVELVTNIRGKKISKDQLHEHTARAIAFGDIDLGTEEAAALALGVMKPADDAPRRRRSGVDTQAVHAYCGTSTSNLTRYAFTVALFAGEALLEEMRRNWNPAPKGTADWHLDFLVRLGYELSAVETKAYRAKAAKS